MTNGFLVTGLASLAMTLLAVTLVAGALARLGFPFPPANGRIGHIDGLRGYLATSVLACHFIVWVRMIEFGSPWERSPVIFFAELGGAGVALFFMTTGLVFYPRILRGFRACDWPSIYIGRLFRILPLSIAAFIAQTAIVMSRTGEVPSLGYAVPAAKWILGYATPDLLGYARTFEITAGVIWSLWYEWLFYIFVLPACAIASDMLRGKAPSWVVPVGLFTAGLLARLVWPDKLPLYLPLFACGMLSLEIGGAQRAASWLIRPATGALALLALGLAMSLFETPYYLSLPLLALFFVAVANGNSMFGMLSTRASQVLGEISFSIYLLHPIVLNLMFEPFRASGQSITSSPTTTLWLMPVAGALVVLVSATTYVLIERPAMSLGRRIAKIWQGYRAQTPRSVDAVA